jgi:hypothetical protein
LLEKAFENSELVLFRKQRRTTRRKLIRAKDKTQLAEKLKNKSEELERKGIPVESPR